MRCRMPGYAPRGRYVRKDVVPFQEILPLKLKSQVSAKGEQQGGAHCVQEMSVFFACLKKNEFEERHCSVELASFQKCVTVHEATQAKKVEAASKGSVAPGESNLTHRQISSLLRRFPS